MTEIATPMQSASHERKREITVDKFHRGAFEVIQQSGGAHRSGMDAMLLGASLPQGATGKLADLGASTGAAGLAAITTHPSLEATFVEIQPELVNLGRNTLTLSGNRHIKDRARFLQTDVTYSGAARQEAGLDPASFDFVITNPPYNPASLQPSPSKNKARSHVIGVGGLDPWMRTASAILKPGGMFALVYRSDRLGEIIACAQGRFGDVRILPIYSKPDEAAKRVIVRAVRGSRAPLTIVPGLVMHNADGSSTAEADAIINGQSSLNFAD